MKQRVGIFGGTFDPPHRGHLQVARAACDELKLDRLLWIPAGTPPHKRSLPLSEAHHRVAMTEFMVAEDDRFALELFEVSRSTTSFTVETLRYLRRMYPEDALVLIMGEDQWVSFDSWSQPAVIRSLAEIAVYHRAADGNERYTQLSTPDYWLSGSLLAETSTAIRQRVFWGEKVTDDLLETVAAYVNTHALYR